MRRPLMVFFGMLFMLTAGAGAVWELCRQAVAHAERTLPQPVTYTMYAGQICRSLYACKNLIVAKDFFCSPAVIVPSTFDWSSAKIVTYYTKNDGLYFEAWKPKNPAENSAYVSQMTNTEGLQDGVFFKGPYAPDADMTVFEIHPESTTVCLSPCLDLDWWCYRLRNDLREYLLYIAMLAGFAFGGLLGSGLAFRR